MQRHVQLARMHALRVLVEFGSASSPAHGIHLRQLGHQTLRNGRDAAGFLQ